MLVHLRGELDLFSLGRVRDALDAAKLGDHHASVDLSGVTFMDLQVARELAVRSQVDARNLAFVRPSPQATASIEALGLGDWFLIQPGRPGDDREGPVLAEGRLG